MSEAAPARDLLRRVYAVLVSNQFGELYIANLGPWERMKVAYLRQDIEKELAREVPHA